MTTEQSANPIARSPIPEIDCPLSAAEVLERLDAAARRGKLPGFAKGVNADGPSRFQIADFGTPFESILTASVLETAGGSRLQFQPPRLKPLFPWAFGIILLLTIWPGAWLTDSMLRSYWDWYGSRPWWVTYIWYLPLTVPFCPPALLSALRKSRASAAAEIPDLVEKIVAATGGRANSISN